MFELKYRCLHCILRPDSATNHDYFFTCIDSRQQKTKRIVILKSRLDKLHTHHTIIYLLIHYVDNCYNHELHHDLPSTTTSPVFLNYIAKQTAIGWEHFVRGKITSFLHPVINTYYRINKLRRRFTFSSWYRDIIQYSWQLHLAAWIEYCDANHSSTNLNIIPSPAKITLLTLVEKYKTEATILLMPRSYSAGLVSLARSFSGVN